MAGERFGSMRAFHLEDALGFPRVQERSAGVAALRSDIDDVVGVANHVEVVFDGDNGISFFHEPVENVEQFGNV